MKRTSLLLMMLFVLGFVSPAFSQDFLSKKVVKLGEMVPEFNLKDTDGNLVRRSEYKGSILMIVYWSARCPFSERYDPRVKKIVTDYASKGVNVIGIDSNVDESLEEIKKVIKERDLNYSILLDPGNLIANEYGAITTPHVFIIDRAGLLVYEGAIDDQEWSDKNPISQNYAREALDATITDEILVTPKTKPFGCTIKRVS